VRLARSQLWRTSALKESTRPSVNQFLSGMSRPRGDVVDHLVAALRSSGTSEASTPHLLRSFRVGEDGC
jgi:hypothetical protein